MFIHFMPQLDLVVYAGLISLLSVVFFFGFFIFVEFFLPIVLSKLLVLKNFFLSLFNTKQNKKTENFDAVTLTSQLHFYFYPQVMHFFLVSFGFIKFDSILLRQVQQILIVEEVSKEEEN